MPSWGRSIDVSSATARAALVRVGRELREARQDRGLSIDMVAAAVGISNAEVSRIERGLAPRVPLVTLALLAGAVGLDLSVRLFPGGLPVRDRYQLALLIAFRSSLHRMVTWATEVPVGPTGDLRAWDAVVSGQRDDGGRWAYGVEAETLPRDVQALQRRLQLKLRDSGLDGVLLVLPTSRRAKEFVRLAAPVLAESFPVPGARALELLAAGVAPGGSAIIQVRVPRTVVPARGRGGGLGE